MDDPSTQSTPKEVPTQQQGAELHWQYEPLQGLPPDALATNSWLMNAMRDQAYRWIRRWLERQFDFRVEGTEVFQRTPQFLLIANHTSHLDAICLLAALPSGLRNRCYSAAAEDYFYTHVCKEQMARLLANTFPFRRRSDTHLSLAACARILERGDSLLLFPEGTRSTTGELQLFHSGIGVLAQGRSYPVIPAYLDGTHHALAKGQVLCRRTRILLRVGWPEAFQDAPLGKESAIAIANHLRDRVEALRGDGGTT